MTGSLKRAGFEIVKTAVKRQHEPQRLAGDLLKARDQREARPVDQVPDDDRQAAARQGRRRLRLRRHAEALVHDLAGGLCERTSVIVATNLAFGEWPSVFGDAK